MARINEKLKLGAFVAAKGKCVYCDLDSRVHISVFCAMEVDHVPPHASKKSKDTPEGVVLCCPHCNKMLASHKNVLTVEERRSIVQKGLAEKKQDWFNSWMQILDQQTNS